MSLARSRARKNEPFTVRIFNINQHKVFTKFLDICKSKESNAKAIFGTIDVSWSKYGALWDKVCLARCGQYLCKRRLLYLSDCGIKEEERQYYFDGMTLSYRQQYRKKCHGSILKDQPLYCWRVAWGYLFSLWLLTKRKNLFAQFSDFCDQDYCKILKCYSVCWLGMSVCIERVIKLFPFLQSYYLSSKTNATFPMESASRNNRLIVAFKDPSIEVMLMFLHVALPLLINLN